MYEHQQTSKPEPIQRKHESFRVDIRRRQIEQHLQACRKKYILFKTQQNYHLLKHINIPQTIREFRNDPLSQEPIHSMFLYASSSQADHLYSHFEDTMLFSLLDLLHQRPSTPTQKKALIILSNYTAYHSHQQYPLWYIQKLSAIAKTSKTRYILSNVIMAFANMVDCSSMALMFVNNAPLLQQMLAAFQSAVEEPAESQQLIQYHCAFYENLFEHTYYEQVPPSMQGKALSLLVRSLESMGNERTMRHVLRAFKNLFGNSLDQSPQLILEYEGLFYQIGRWAHSYSQLEPKRVSWPIVEEYLNWLKIIYGINVPEEGCEEIFSFYLNYLEKELEPLCEWVFELKKQFLTVCLLDLLRLVLLEKELSETFLHQNYKIFMQILWYAEESTQLRTVKNSLTCIVNMVKTLMEDPETKEKFGVVIKNHSIQELLQGSIRRYSDPQFNMELVEAIEILGFCSEEGFQSIEQLVEETGSEELKAVGNRALDSLDIIQ